MLLTNLQEREEIEIVRDHIASYVIRSVTFNFTFDLNLFYSDKRVFESKLSHSLLWVCTLRAHYFSFHSTSTMFMIMNAIDILFFSMQSIAFVCFALPSFNQIYVICCKYIRIVYLNERKKKKTKLNWKKFCTLHSLYAQIELILKWWTEMQWWSIGN